MTSTNKWCHGPCILEASGFSGKSGTSIKTCQAVLTLVQRWRPPVVILENVRQLLYCRAADNGNRPVDHIDAVMESLGYKGHASILCPRDFGVPQRRKRAWLVYFMSGAGDPETALSMCLQFRAQSPELHYFLQPMSVVQWKKRVASRGENWRQKLATFKQSAKITDREMKEAASILEQSPAFHKLTLRCRSNLTITLALAQKRGHDFRLMPLVLTFDQDVPRSQICPGFAPCLLPSGYYWVAWGSPENHRPMSGREMFALQGVGPEEVGAFGLAGLSEPFMRDLAGNAFNAFVCAAVTTSALINWAGPEHVI